MNPRDAGAFYNRGIAYGVKGLIDRAIQDYDKAIGLNPKCAAAFRERGLVYRRKGQTDQAIQDFDQAIHLDPEDAAALRTGAMPTQTKASETRQSGITVRQSA